MGKPGPKPGTKLGLRGKDTPHKKWHREYMRRRRARERREKARKK